MNRHDRPVRTAGISKENKRAMALWLVVLLIPGFLLFRWLGLVAVAVFLALVVYSGLLVANWGPTRRRAGQADERGVRPDDE